MNTLIAILSSFIAGFIACLLVWYAVTCEAFRRGRQGVPSIWVFIESLWKYFR